MCIIIAKPAGVELPPEQHFENAFKNNPDGAGIAYNDGTRTYIRKGFMEFSQFQDALKLIPNPREKDMVFHFRIATHGKVCPENCHPFPLTSSLPQLQKTELDYNGWVVCHNGIIPRAASKGENGFFWNKTWVPNVGSYQAPYSDTQQYIMEKLSRLGTAIFNPVVQEWIEEDTNYSLWAVLTKNRLSLIGNFTEKLGVQYSNSSAFHYTPISFYDGYYTEPKKYYSASGNVITDFDENLQTFVHSYSSETRCELCNTPVYTLYEYPNQDFYYEDDVLETKLCPWCFRWVEENTNVLNQPGTVQKTLKEIEDSLNNRLPKQTTYEDLLETDVPEEDLEDFLMLPYKGFA